MAMEQANHFLEEARALYELIKSIGEDDYERVTLFKNWTINDILVHLHFWNMSADLSLNQPDEFDKMMKHFFSAIQTGKLRLHENAIIKERGSELLELWFELSQKLANDFSAVDPKQRLKWAGPSMSARTCISARQMEVWAHALAVFDLIGTDRIESDRIKNVVVLGINAFGWTHQVHSLSTPENMPYVRLISPSGEQWEFGEESASEIIEGHATDFAKVVTQTRNIADTNLVVSGKDANIWMQHAQCFAGPPEKPPVAGLRKKS